MAILSEMDITLTSGGATEERPDFTGLLNRFGVC
jgi:hypothetical protein